VGSFIADTEGIITTNELKKATNMDVDSDDEDIDRGTLGGEYDESRPHAGTGGSSKMKSRPNPSMRQANPQQQAARKSSQRSNQAKGGTKSYNSNRVYR